MNVAAQRRFILAVRGATEPAELFKQLTRREQGSQKARLLIKTGGECEGCDRTLPDPDMMHVHHVTPVSRGGTNEHRNVTLVCPNCHAIGHWIARTMPDGEQLGGRRDLLIRLRAMNGVERRER